MRRMALLVVTSLAVIAVWLLPSSASALFSQCPPVVRDTGCQFLVVVGEGGTQVVEDPAQPPYDPGGEDALLAVQNNSSKPISSIGLYAGNDFFGFDNDGICHNVGQPWAPGCVVLAENTQRQPMASAGASCPPEKEVCGFPPPAGEPAANTFPAGISIVGYGANGDAVTGYEGPTSWFSDISPDAHEGIVHFSPAIASGASAYFALESPPLGEIPAVLTPTSTSTKQSGGGLHAAMLTVPAGTPVQDGATLAGSGIATASGVVTYTLYRDRACTSAAAKSSTATVVAGRVGLSAPVTPAPGKYYWRAAYSGDSVNAPSSGACGDEVLQVARPADFKLPPTKTCLSRRRFIAHPRSPRGVSLTHVTVMVNGKRRFTGRLVGTHTTIDLRGLPVGTFHVAMIARSSKNRLYEDLRTYHTCIPRHRRSSHTG
jgi:hypothetical protein